MMLNLSFGMAFAVEPADSNIKGALGDIERYEKQFPESSSPRSSNIKRALKLLKITRQRLDSSNNKTHESWVLADQRYTNLVNNLQAFLDQPKKATSSSQSTTAVTGSASTKKQVTESKATMISQGHVRVKKLGRDIESAIDSLDHGGLKPFQDPDYVKKFDDASARFQISLDKYAAFSDDAGVQKTTTALAKLNNTIRYGKEQAKPVIAELGNVQQKLAEIQKGISNRRPPSEPQTPYTAESILNWIQQASQVRSISVSDFQRLKVIREKAWLPNNTGTVQQGAAFDMQDVNRLQSGMRNDVENIDNTLKQLEANLKLQVTDVQDSLDWYAKLDPSDAHTRANSFLGEGDESEALQSLDNKLKIVEASIVFDQQLKRPTLSQRQSLRDNVTKTITNYKLQRKQALKLARMPRSVSNDKTLFDIAQRTLEKPDYGVGKIMRMVINSDKVKREKETSEVEIDEVDISLSGEVKLSGTGTKTRYEWEQYQVSTAEPVGEKYFIFYNTLKFFTAGATTTPLNRWILSGRFKGSEIPQQNIELD